MNLTARVIINEDQYEDLTRHTRDFQHTSRTIMQDEYRRAQEYYKQQEFTDNYYIIITTIKHAPDFYYQLIAEYNPKRNIE